MRFLLSSVSKHIRSVCYIDKTCSATVSGSGASDVDLQWHLGWSIFLRFRVYVCMSLASQLAGRLTRAPNTEFFFFSPPTPLYSIAFFFAFYSFLLFTIASCKHVSGIYPINMGLDFSLDNMALPQWSLRVYNIWYIIQTRLEILNLYICII